MCHNLRFPTCLAGSSLGAVTWSSKAQKKNLQVGLAKEGTSQELGNLSSVTSPHVIRGSAVNPLLRLAAASDRHASSTQTEYDPPT
jgi:hypothetical protein